MTVIELHNAGNTEAQQKEGLAYLLAQVSQGKAATGVLSGLGVSQTTTASKSVQVAAGGAVAQASVLVGASLLVNDTTITLDVLTANPLGSLPRNDIIVLDAATLDVHPVIGTPNATPSDPTVPSTAVPLARIRNAADATTVPASAIDDLRPWTALAGAPVPVRNATERDALTPGAGRMVYRLDTGLIEVSDGTTWREVAIPQKAAYTPTWTGLSTNPTLGNGALTGFYRKVGKTVEYEIAVKPGTTTAGGSGQWVWALPFPSDPGYTVRSTVGQALLYDVSSANFYPATVILAGASSVSLITASGAIMSNGTPVTIANGDLLTITGRYEAAS